MVQISFQRMNSSLRVLSYYNNKNNKTNDDVEIPIFGKFASNHVMVNQARVSYGLKPLNRRRSLDDLARSCTELIAHYSNGQDDTEQEEFQSNLKQLLNHHAIDNGGAINIQTGTSVRDMHDSTIHTPCRERNNILGRYYSSFGMATARINDGKLIMCQLFRDDSIITTSSSPNTLISSIGRRRRLRLRNENANVDTIIKNFKSTC